MPVALLSDVTLPGLLRAAHEHKGETDPSPLCGPRLPWLLRVAHIDNRDTDPIPYGRG